jgi:hypothetical protein
MSQFLLAIFAAVAAQGPCDIFEKAGTPCVAAHSVVRAMYTAYDGPLYAVRRLSDNMTQDIKTLSAGGVADAAVQDAYCNEASKGCTIATIYDQSPQGNHLRAGPARGGEVDLEVNATKDPLTLGGKKVYSAYFERVSSYPGNHTKHVGVGYRINNTTGVAKGDDPETMYMVTSGQHFNEGCCFDYGNAETFIGDAGCGTMEAISISNGTSGMHGAHHGTGNGPWIFADLENGLWVGNGTKAPSIVDEHNNTYPFVTAMIKGGSNNHWAIKGGDATASDGLKTLFDGPRPCAGQPPACLSRANHTYSPMRKYGAIILGVGGDNSHGGVGTFYEGAITKGYSTDAADSALQANIAAAGYGK